LIYKGTGIKCNKCSYVPKKIVKDEAESEVALIQGLKLICSNLKFKILKEGTKADFCLQPVMENTDSWLPIQLKTTTVCDHGVYSFHINNDYTDMLVLCIFYTKYCQRMWLIPGNVLKVKNLSIEMKNSCYDKYQTGSCNLEEHFTLYYLCEKYNKPLQEINTPISKAQVQEHEFSEYRQKLFPHFNILQPTINCRAYDCVINNGIKIQDKVLCRYTRNIRNSSYTYLIANVHRHTGKIPSLYEC
jgi:hypothetical protein